MNQFIADATIIFQACCKMRYLFALFFGLPLLYCIGESIHLKAEQAREKRQEIIDRYNASKEAVQC